MLCAVATFREKRSTAEKVTAVTQQLHPGSAPLALPLGRRLIRRLP
jgi:hypothetical protein